MVRSKSQWQCRVPDKLTNCKDIHIWRACLELKEFQINGLLETLSSDELDRARRYHFKKDQDRFICSRGILRKIIAYYLGENPKNLQFEYTSLGKPLLAENSNFYDLHFNISHSNTLALYAIASKSIVGIDIEYLRKDTATEQIARKFFTQNEISSLKNAPEARREKLFYQFWTRKEAILKAIGKGISFPMDQLDVSSINGTAYSPARFPEENKALRKLYLQDIKLDEGYVAAIAYEGCGKDISFWNYIQ